MVAFVADDIELHHSKAIYNLLDFLGDVGGLSDALRLIAWGILNIFASEGMINSLISKVFYTEPQANQSESF